jgi:hypothetical protein
MEVAFTSLSAAALRRSTLVSLLPPVLRLILTGGGSIATAYSRRPSRPEYQFAMHRPAGSPTDFPIYSPLPDDEILEAFVRAVCAITGCNMYRERPN